MSLANYWQGTDRFPADVQRMFESVGDIALHETELLLSIPEYETELPATGVPAFADLFVLARSRTGLVAMIVESRVNEPFDSVFGGMRWKMGDVIDQRTTLPGLADILEISLGEAANTRYQLLHRTAAAILESKRFSATAAIMLVHSFSNERKWFEDYEAFGDALGVSVEYGQLVDAGIRSGRRLLLGWLTSPVKEET